MQITNSLNEARLAGVISWFAAGSGSGTAEIYDGTQPAFGAAPTGCNLLTTIAFNEPIGAIADGVLTISATAEAINIASGTATWARIKNGNGDHGWDCAVSDTAGSAPLKLSSTVLYLGGFTRIASGTLV